MTKQKALDQLRIMQAWHEDNGNGPNADYDAICYAIGVIEAQPEPFRTIKHAGSEHPLSDEEIIPRLRQIQEQVGGSYAIDRAIELLTAQPEPCEDAVSRKDCLQALSHLMDVEGFRDGWAVSRANVECMLKAMPPVTPKQPDCAKCKSEFANKIRGQQDNTGMLTENDKGRNWGLEWAAQIVEGKRR